MKQKVLVFLKKITSPRVLPVLCYGIILLGWLAVSAAGFAADMVLAANGALAQQPLAVNNFTLDQLEVQPDGTLQATDHDPKMFLNQLPQTVRTLRMEATYSSKPYEINLYYTTRPGEDFGKDRRVWPVLQPDGSYLFTLPRQHIEALRLDPASAAVEIDIAGLTLNVPRSAASYFNPGWDGLVLLLVLPAFVAAGLRWVLNVIQYYTKRKQT